MTRLKTIYVGSILVAIFLVSMMIRSIVHQPPEVMENETIVKHSLIEFGGSAIVYLSIYNGENQSMNYVVQTVGMSPERRLKVPIVTGRSKRFTWYIHDKRDISLLIYKEGHPVPIENITYYLSKKEEQM